MLKKPSKKQAVIIGAAALVVVVGGSLFAKMSLGAKAETKTVLPSVTELMNGDIDERVTASGAVQAADEYSIFIEPLNGGAFKILVSTSIFPSRAVNFPFLKTIAGSKVTRLFNTSISAL